jgi:hypothetical protein
MQNITEGKSKAKITSAMIQRSKLDITFELKAKYGITKGTIVNIQRPVQGRVKIEKDPIPSDQESTQTDYRDFNPNDNCMYVGTFYDYWTGRMFLEFVAPEGILYYDYSQHSAGDKSFGDIFKVEVAATTKHGVI